MARFLKFFFSVFTSLIPISNYHHRLAQVSIDTPLRRLFAPESHQSRSPFSYLWLTEILLVWRAQMFGNTRFTWSNWFDEINVVSWMVWSGCQWPITALSCRRIVGKNGFLALVRASSRKDILFVLAIHEVFSGWILITAAFLQIRSMEWQSKRQGSTSYSSKDAVIAKSSTHLPYHDNVGGMDVSSQHVALESTPFHARMRILKHTANQYLFPTSGGIPREVTEIHVLIATRLHQRLGSPV